eukprot:CAMPEP_0202882098 /NCGR_PEP_ID=MMETSP1391-20130828/37534_1 /ASSEMBLY_ACC=CAM_ASM_000867 /TAXON_ID=1034604 /ORGANISM="Chlamydomonas leiostraca, Strain SAG 11-49" /LENGTH=147 /DNA_ID=CAMNT_0049564903 /DNA_START=216 /DNA_END=661 /DNA_ORIENTATION=-
MAWPAANQGPALQPPPSTKRVMEFSHEHRTPASHQPCSPLPPLAAVETLQQQTGGVQRDNAGSSFETQGNQPLTPGQLSDHAFAVRTAVKLPHTGPRASASDQAAALAALSTLPFPSSFLPPPSTLAIGWTQTMLCHGPPCTNLQGT